MSKRMTELERLARAIHRCPEEYMGPCWGPNPEDYEEALRRLTEREHAHDECDDICQAKAIQAALIDGPDHAFKPGTTIDNDPPSDLWCDVCGESRAKAHPEHIDGSNDG